MVKETMTMAGNANKLDRNSEYIKIVDLPSRVNIYQPITNHDLETRIHLMTSSFLLCIGYVLFLVGMTSSSWRLEIGYVYGLWVRCDEVRCKYVISGFNEYLTLVRSGMAVSLILLTMSTICLLLEWLTRSLHASKRHVFRTDTIKFYSSAIGGILTAASLTLYGCKTVMAQDRLPALSWGFALTALSVKFTLLGAISRAMGPPSTWKNGLSCLVSKSQFNKTNHRSYKLETSNINAPEYCNIPRQKVGLLSCCQKTKGRYTYISIPSPGCSTLDSNYRHYEEISFEDMPPPPLELLHPYLDSNAPPWLEDQQPLAYPHEAWSPEPPRPKHSQRFGQNSLPQDSYTQSVNPEDSVDRNMRLSLERASGSPRRPQVKPASSSQNTQPPITPRQSKQKARPSQLTRQSSDNSAYSVQNTRQGETRSQRSRQYQTMPAALHTGTGTRPPRTRPRGHSQQQRQPVSVDHCHLH